MRKKLYVGNLVYTVTDATLEQMFAGHGSVQSAQVIMDRDTGRSKGFGFVEMGSDHEAQAAISALNGTNVDGRNLTVNEASHRLASIMMACDSGLTFARPGSEYKRGLLRAPSTRPDPPTSAWD